MRRAESRTGLKADFPIRSIGNEGPVFIIGSGASLLEFDHTAHLTREVTSITINNALFSDVRSDFHSYELDPDPVFRPYVDERIATVVQNSSVQFLCRLPRSLSDFSLYPSNLLLNPNRSHLFASIDALPESGFLKQLDFYLSPNIPVPYPGIDPGFSLGRILLRLIKMGYKDIRLVGVDLFSSDHFWHHSEEHAWMRKHKGSNNRAAHGTTDKSRRWPADSFLCFLEQQGDRFGFRLTTHRKSQTAEILPTW